MAAEGYPANITDAANNDSATDIAKFIADMPKAELHVHLE